MRFSTVYTFWLCFFWLPALFGMVLPSTLSPQGRKPPRWGFCSRWKTEGPHYIVAISLLGSWISEIEAPAGMYEHTTCTNRQPNTTCKQQGILATQLNTASRSNSKRAIQTWLASAWHHMALGPAVLHKFRIAIFCSVCYDTNKHTRINSQEGLPMYQLF
jgi:hypothetical protein